ncbi:hypothetical protein NLG97_g210 [Lecanicillium saksenae]|uniref:Uncharacterized protein n=1 Tax=Lecanicillium saksenae TaxID=468837 RepID=A0ACC1R9V9_9HYPO|nr:hypothetical protein NLG97_g210 [Lecanicillium saksenae]
MAPLLLSVLPTRTDPLQPRQASSATATVTVTSEPDSSNSGGHSTLTGGAIAGIVIGSVVGVLVLLWVIRSCFNLGGPTPTPEVEPWNEQDQGAARVQAAKSTTHIKGIQWSAVLAGAALVSARLQI